MINNSYALPESLVSTQWVANHLDHPKVRLIECNEDPLLYSSGHIPGAACVDLARDLINPIQHDY
ncbi:MAG: rhodanese-like domain-containing protein, partial [Chloroflexota bacterium]